MPSLRYQDEAADTCCIIVVGSRNANARSSDRVVLWRHKYHIIMLVACIKTHRKAARRSTLCAEYCVWKAFMARHSALSIQPPSHASHLRQSSSDHSLIKVTPSRDFRQVPWSMLLSLQKQHNKEVAVSCTGRSPRTFSTRMPLSSQTTRSTPSPSCTASCSGQRHSSHACLVHHNVSRTCHASQIESPFSSCGSEPPPANLCQGALSCSCDDNTKAAREVERSVH